MSKKNAIDISNSDSVVVVQYDNICYFAKLFGVNDDSKIRVTFTTESEKVKGKFK